VVVHLPLDEGGDIVTSVALVLVSLTTAWIVLGTVAVAVATRRRPPRPNLVALPPLTVLKPLCGADPALRENLASFFAQDYPRFEIVFGVERADDPAASIARALVTAHPEVRARVVVHGERRGHNPKVRNLRGMLGHARNDLVVVSDSNVRVSRDYLRRMVEPRAASPDVGLVTSVIAGRGGHTLGGALERIALNGFCASGASLPTLLGYTAVIGKSMLFSRRDLEAVGGLGRVADVLAEDFVLGKLFERAGLRTVIASGVVDNVVGDLSVRAFVDRHLRWSMLRFKLRPITFLLEPLTSPLAILPVAWSLWGPRALVWAGVLAVGRDVAGSALLAGPRGLARVAWLSPLREALGLLIWIVTPSQRHVSWRGHRLRVRRGTVLCTD
jgi:ceramide glucosyltransferase